MSKDKLEARIGEASEMLVGEGANQSVARIREIKIYEGDKKLVTVKAADSDEDVLAQIDKAGFVAGERIGDVIQLTRKPMNGTQRGLVGCFAIFALLFVLLIGGCTIGMMNGGDKKDEPTAYDAKYYCQKFVKDKLKAPSTAKFSNQVANGAGRSWTSSGTVESQNSFGGMVATRYSCTLTHNASEQSWSGVARLAE